MAASAGERQRVNGRKDGRNSDGQRELTIKSHPAGPPPECGRDKTAVSTEAIGKNGTSDFIHRLLCRLLRFRPARYAVPR